MDNSKVTKKCKYCQSAIPFTAKVCPVCRKNQGLKAWQIALIVVIALGAIGAIFGTDSNSDNGRTEVSTENSISINNEKEEKTTTSIKKEKLELVGGIDGTSTEGNGFSSYINGTIKNNSNKDYSYVQITFTLYDSDGATVGTAMDNIGGLEAGGIWKFRAMALEDFSRYKLDKITGW